VFKNNPPYLTSEISSITAINVIIGKQKNNSEFGKKIKINTRVFLRLLDSYIRHTHRDIAK